MHVLGTGYEKTRQEAGTCLLGTGETWEVNLFWGLCVFVGTLLG